MAKIMGREGAYLDRVVRRDMIGMLVFVHLWNSLVCFLAGYGVAKDSLSYTFALWVSIPAVSLFLWRLGSRVFDEAEKRKKGLRGERLVAEALAELPDSHLVFHDVTFPGSCGNIDHLVVGPKGIFAIDAKLWKGNIGADRNGELLINGRPTSKPEIRRLERRVMAVNERVQALIGECPWIQAVVAFPYARLDRIWGKTKHTDCLRVDQLVGYIRNSNRNLSACEIQRIARVIGMLKYLGEQHGQPSAKTRKLGGNTAAASMESMPIADQPGRVSGRESTSVASRPPFSKPTC